MNAVMKKTESYMQALMLTGYSHGIIEKSIKDRREKGDPISLEIIEQALAIECTAFGSRPAVVNTLRREVTRQKAELP